jgi:hypothetical protein
MKSWYGTLSFLFFLGMSTGNTASALEGPGQDVTGLGTSATTTSEGPQVIVKAPLFSPLFDHVPLAVINDDPVTLEDLTNSLASSHEERDPAKKLSGGKIDYDKILERLINVRLIVQEATRIGFDELPEFKSSVEDHSMEALGKLLMNEATKDVKADPARVEKRYKESVVEWKIKSLFFEKEDDAKNMADGIKAGKSFEELTAQAVAEGKVKGEQEGNFVRPKDLAPHVLEMISTMETGSISPVIRVQGEKTAGFTILKLEEKRYPENLKTREQVEWSVLNEQKNEAWEKFKTSLVTKYVTLNDKILGKLNYEKSIDKFPQLLEDKRVVAEIKGEQPITVGELTQEIQKKFWHGVEEAAKSKKLNKEIRPALFAIIGRRVIAKEVSERGLAKSEEFQKDLRQFKDSTLFGLFIERMVIPDLNVTDSDLKAYYEKHKLEYRYPEMIKLTSVTFGNKRAAEAALKKLSKGTDISWVRSNAEGLAEKRDDDHLSTLNGSILSMNSLPPAMAKTLAGTHAGDFRLYEGTENRYYVLSIEATIPARQQPFEEVKEALREKAFQEKFILAMDDWFHKLRSASTIKVFLLGTGK